MAMDPDLDPNLQHQQDRLDNFQWVVGSLVALNYAFQLTPSLFFRPGVQYDIRPGATSTHPNTWVFAFHIQLTL